MAWKMDHGIFLVLILLLTLLPVAVLAQPANLEGRPDGGPRLEGITPKLLRQLNLSPDQQKKSKESHLAVQKRKIQLQSDKAIVELDLKNLLSSYPVNLPEVMKIGEKLAEVERKLILLRVESWSQFLGSLTAEQHRKAIDIQADLKEKRKAMRKEGRGD